MRSSAQSQWQRIYGLGSGPPRRHWGSSRSNDSTEATVYLYDPIDDVFGVNAAKFVSDLNAINAPTIHLRINSPGGDVFGGRAIATAVSQHSSRIVAHVDGLAASAASFIAIAANSVEMAPGSFLMIHNAWTIMYGTADEIRSAAALLRKIDDSLVQTYAQKTGKTPKQIRDLMAAETWFSAQEAVDEGFADYVAGDATTDETVAAFDLSTFKNAPKDLAARSRVEAHEQRKQRLLQDIAPRAQRQ